jgi:ubiquinone/menaquinone biosynthesis C-methylase UbiE
MNLSRVLHPHDYKLFTEHLAVEQVMSKLTNYRYEHIHRKWEYGLALKAVLDTESNTVLDVGGAGAVLSPLLAYYGRAVTQIDPASGKEEVMSQNEILGTHIKFISGDFSTVELGKFDAVVSISTIEHVHDDETFFKNLLEHANKTVFITMDFFPTCKKFSKDHIRTYNKERIYEFCKIAEDLGFRPVYSDYDYKGNFVYDYTFASLYLI